MLAEQRGIEVGADGINVVQHQPADVRQLRQRAVAEHVGELEPVADRVQALRRQIVGVIARLAHRLRPADQRRVQAVPDFLFLFVKQLMGGLLPRKMQVARHRNHPQPDRASRRQNHRQPRLLDLPVREVARRDNVRSTFRLRNVNIQKTPVLAAELAERVQRLYNARALRPPAPNARRQRDHRHFAPANRVEAGLVGRGRRPRRNLVQRTARRAVPTKERHIFIPHILDDRRRRQTILREADPSVLEVGADLLVLHAVKAEFVEQVVQALAAGVSLCARKEPVEQRVYHPSKFRVCPAGDAELVKLGASSGAELEAVRLQQRRHDERVIAGGQERAVHVAPRAALVDGEVIDDRLHRERQRVLQLALGRRHDFAERFLGGGLDARIKDESHAAAAHAAEHPESEKLLAEPFTDPVDHGLSVQVRRPRNDGLDRAEKVARCRRADGRNISGTQRLDDFIQNFHRFLAGLPLGLGAEEVFLRHHLQNRADVLRHATMDKDK